MSDPTLTDIKSDSEPWSTLENLILAQAIYKCGDTNWVAIARTIKGHPQVHRSSNFFSQKSCAIQYTQLLENLEAETRSKQARGGNEAEMSSVVKLAGQLYNQRILEIKEQIRKDEERFRALVAELDDIRQGKWDNQLEEELKRNPPPPEPEMAVNGTESATTVVSQPQPESESALGETTVPSFLSSPSSSTLSEKQESSSQSVQGQPETEKPGLPLTETSDSKDVEMEDVSATEQPPQEPTSSSEDISALIATGEDVVMEDVGNNISSPAVSIHTGTDHKGEAADKNATPETGSAKSSSTSTSDLSLPEVTEEDENITPESGPETVTIKTEHDTVETKGQTSDEAKVDTESMDMAENEVDEGEEGAPQRKKLRTKNTPSESLPEAEEEVEHAVNKAEEEKNDTEAEAGPAPEGHDEEASSAEEEETASTTKSSRKPKKIKTTVPIKRKRRGGRGSTAGDTEEGYHSSDSETTDSAHTNMSDQIARTQMDDKKWKKILMMIWTDIANHRFGAVFMHPIKEQDAPGYYYMIKRPMDLKSIKERIRDGQIANADEFHRDVLLMFMNALMYNREDTEVYQMALAMMNEVEHVIKNFKSSQSLAPTTISSGSGTNSLSTTPTTRTASTDAHHALSSAAVTGSSGAAQHVTRKRKSSGLEMTPVE
ncbi:Bromodomain-containing protein 8 [Mortierella polycephala]|uniref:Bromodomain-containing protein 8 n=1 Tax=Mortierella polycephala TaxID=41804 RepID=A0A9P6Q997_9FUNG|nr:Bromodomain-containing protein 8 [Mortierella polycephala]